MCLPAVQGKGAAELKLLDEDSRQVLAMFASHTAPAPAGKAQQAQQAQQAAWGAAGRDITNTRHQVSSSCAGLAGGCGAVGRGTQLAHLKKA